MASNSAFDETPSLTHTDNPLLKDFDFPPYDIVEPKHVQPGIRQLIDILEADLVELERTLEPTWPKLVEPLERIINRWGVVVGGIVNHLRSVKDSSELRTAIEEIQQDKVKFEMRLGQNKPIYEAFKSIRNSSSWETLSEARKRIVEGQIKEAVLGGVALEDEKREKFNEIEQELAKLHDKFAENVLDATKRFEKVIVDKKEIEGLPATVLGLAAEKAKIKGHEYATPEKGPWIITLDAQSYAPVMQHVRNRSLREELFKAYMSRASSGDLDNASIISQILKLRLQKANLLGYNNFAELSMANKIATIERVEELLEKLRVASWDHHVRDLEEIKAFAKESGAPEANEINYWDIDFWSERLREAKYDINEEELRPYFALSNVLDGLFSLANKLFDINIESADGLAPVWDPDVQFYRVNDSSGESIAYFYLDPYCRPAEKQGGAWMAEVFYRSHVLASPGAPFRLPVAFIICNQMPPVGDKPSLMTFYEVETVFHEFGHALQHMLTKQDEGLVSGIRGIEWDAVELPSQFMENWCYHRGTLLSLAKHYGTGEPLPEEAFSKIIAAKNFRAGSLSLRQIRLASVDMELHTKFDPYGELSIFDVYQKVWERTSILPPSPHDKYLCVFRHVFAGLSI
ncbi:Organellar oligopeptidase A [Carex littledalei]|uniref:oligopeptidase A n=1 Tax=Carex littledalei TaxID=544730 RepID=A0A833RBD7_9POAL|nr:Organellar oligopeptidase A [Carex littledalei]